MNTEIADITPERRKFRNDGPDLLPELGQSLKATMTRISVACTVKNVAQQISSWGKGATTTPTLAATINFYNRDNMASKVSSDEVAEFIASWVPNGLAADMDAMGRDERRALMRPCIEAAAAHEARYRQEKRA